MLCQTTLEPSQEAIVSMVCVCVVCGVVWGHCEYVILCCADTACCLNPHTQTYYNFDDHDVKEASAKQVKVANFVISTSEGPNFDRKPNFGLTIDPNNFPSSSVFSLYDAF